MFIFMNNKIIITTIFIFIISIIGCSINNNTEVKKITNEILYENIEKGVPFNKQISDSELKALFTNENKFNDCISIYKEMSSFILTQQKNIYNDYNQGKITEDETKQKDDDIISKEISLISKKYQLSEEEVEKIWALFSQNIPVTVDNFNIKYGSVEEVYAYFNGNAVLKLNYPKSIKDKDILEYTIINSDNIIYELPDYIDNITIWAVSNNYNSKVISINFDKQDLEEIKSGKETVANIIKGFSKDKLYVDSRIK